MKQEPIKLEAAKEVLQYKWEVFSSMDGNIYITSDTNDIAVMNTKAWGLVSKSHAELICKAVNDYQSLIKENDRLNEILSEIERGLSFGSLADRIKQIIGNHKAKKDWERHLFNK